MTLKQMIWLLLLLWNIIVGLVYVWDKYCAIKGRWRVSEKNLLGMTLLAGGFGAIFAALLCHHKTRKWYFHLSWWIGLILAVFLSYLLLH